MALFKTINSIDDFDELGNVLSNTLGINLQLNKDISNSENIVEDLWNISLEKCNSFLDLNDKFPNIKSALFYSSVETIEDTYLQIIKKHVIFSAYHTLSCMLDKKLDNKEYIFEHLFKTYCGEMDYNSNYSLYHDPIEALKLRINRTYEDLVQSSQCTYFKNILGITSEFNYECIDSSAFNLLTDILEGWSSCPYNPKFQKKTTYRYKHYLEFEEALIRYKKISKKYPIKSYILERSFNFSFIHELLALLHMFKEEPNSDFYIIDKDKYGEYYGERRDKLKDLFTEEILLRRISPKIQKVIYNDEIKTVPPTPSESRLVRIHKNSIEEFFETLSCFAAMPNVYTRKKFIYFAINMYYNVFEEDFDNWKREILLFVDQLTILTFPALEGCFLYLFLQNNVIDGKCKLKKCKKILGDYINQSDIIKDIETFLNTNNSNSGINEPTQKTLNEKILTTIYHNIMKNVEENSNLYNLLVVDTEHEKEVRNAVNTLKA